MGTLEISSPVIFEFGSRSGSYFALALFGSIFAVLGWGIAREIRRRLPKRSRWWANVAGVLLFACPVSLIYASSLNGFYEAEVRGDKLLLRYLLSGQEEAMPLSEISKLDEAYVFKGRWRLHIARSTGERYVSATWGHAPVSKALAEIRARVEAARRSK